MNKVHISINRSKNKFNNVLNSQIIINKGGNIDNVKVVNLILIG